MIMRMRYELVNTWTTYRYIHTNIHKYSDFLIVVISVGLAAIIILSWHIIIIIIIISIALQLKS